MLARFFIERPVFAWVLATVIMLAGGLAMAILPVSKYPDIAPPSVMITANYPGASAEVVENSVTQVLEQELKGLDNLMYFNSTSSAAGRAEIMLTFKQGTDPDVAQVQVQNKASQASSRLPRQVQQNGLVVTKQQGSFLMIAAFYDKTDRRSDTDISDWLSSTLQDPLSRVEGVGMVQNFGSPYAMRVWLDPHKLNGYGLMPTDVTKAIAEQNTEVSVGELGARPSSDEQQLNATVTALSRLQSVEQFRQLVLKTRSDGAVVRLADVARVELGSEDYSSTSRLNGHPASGLAFMLAPGANALDTAEAIKAKVAQLAGAFPAGIEVAYPEDTTRSVKLSLREVLKTLVEAVVLVVLVMYLFLQNWRATLIPAITVPVVLLGTLAVLALAGYSINTLTLFAMVLAIGLLVDDAIVVVENVERIMREQGLDARSATLASMREITGALVGIAIVLGAVFLPMAFFSGSVGVIYRQFSVTIVAAMALSVVVAVCLTPVLCATFLKPEHGQPRGLFGWFNRRFEQAQTGYGKQLRSLLTRPVRFSLVYLAIVGLMVFLHHRLPTAFVPDEDQGTVMVQFNLPSGATYPRTAKIVQAVERHFLEGEKADIDAIYTLSGFSFGGSGQNAGMAFISLKDWSERQGAEHSAAAIAERANGALSELRDADVFSMVLPPIDGLGQTNGFEFWLQDISGQGQAKLVEAREQLVNLAQQDKRLMAVRANGSDNTPQLRVDIDQAKASVLGLDLTDVNGTLATAWGGAYVNDFVHHGRVKKVFVQADAPYRSRPEDISLWAVRSGNGAMAPFSAFADTRWDNGPAQLRRYNGLPAMQVFGSAAGGVSSGEAMEAIEKMAARLPGTNYEWSGLSYQDKLSSGQAPLLYAASILFVFLCLAALYESWTVPCAVLLVFPLGVVGAMLAVTVRGMPSDIYFQVGLLTTIGLSAKNAILIIEFAEAAVKQGATALEGVIEGARLRLRPIVMTSLAFGAGVIPLVIADGPGSASQNAIGTGVLGGVLSATVLAIFFVPLFYVLVRALPLRRGKEAARRLAME
ncbi:efflux RND transporter permease subunit [Chitinimonas arctica]|uniref:Efflux pump membrane transporter n=1 Tax=Chitinimonas arctica TaxID=2594795 RepID=A0A516SGB5_9NEIS|nr:efflux RND transporter permease subunit [Chitinimonas arctica]QDQ27209.1 efflux RND transporter permease subunit [Chitinimonas arctica]